MNFKHIWTNYKIYAFIAGVILGTLVYNYIGIDYSFASIKQLQAKDFIHFLLYLLVTNMKYGILIFILSFFKIKDKLILLIIFYQSFIMSGLIVLSISLGTFFLLSGTVIAIFKILSAVIMFHPSKKVLNRIIGMALLVFGSIIQNIFLIYF